MTKKVEFTGKSIKEPIPGTKLTIKVNIVKGKK